MSLPKAGTAKELNAATGIAVTLTKEHVIYLNDEIVTLKELRRRLSNMRPAHSVLIRSDRSAYVSKLVELWDLCRDAGLREIHIATLTE